MKWRTGLLWLGLLGGGGAAAQSVQTLDGELADGLGRFRIEAPTDWSAGDRLIVYNHGFRMGDPLAEPPSTAPSDASRSFWLEQGYALAAGSYSNRGWALFDLARAQLALLAAVDQRLGRPGEIILFGGSLGGLVSLRSAEILHEEGRPAAAVLAACAPAGGARSWQQALDARLLFDAVCPSPLPPGSEPMPWALDLDDIPDGLDELDDPDSLLRLASAANRIRQCTGLFQPALLDTPEQLSRRARLKQLLTVSSDEFLLQQLAYALYPMSDLLRDPAKLAGYSGVANSGVDYGDPVLNLQIRRAARDPLAAVKLAAVSDLSGRWGDTRVLALHGSGDELVFPEHLSELAALHYPGARPPVTALVTGTVAAHCDFSERELQASFNALRDWLDGAEAPTATALQAACEASGLPGECRIGSSEGLARLDQRQRPRPAAVDAVSSNHSGAWFDPAYGGEGWWIEVLPGGVDATVTWYSYPAAGEDGEQAWLVGLGRIAADGIHVADLYRFRRPPGEAFDPAVISGERWGELSLAFERCGDAAGPNGVGRLRYRGPASHGEGERQLWQLSFNAILPTHCLAFIQPQTPAPQSQYSGSWYRGAGQGGDGLQFQVGPDGRGVLIWYRYAPDGTPAWLLGLAEREVADGQWDFELLRPRGTRFGADFDPADVSTPSWGRGQLRFADCDHGEFRWDADEVGWADGAMPLRRLSSLVDSATCLNLP